MKNAFFEITQDLQRSWRIKGAFQQSNENSRIPTFFFLSILQKLNVRSHFCSAHPFPELCNGVRTTFKVLPTNWVTKMSIVFPHDHIHFFFCNLSNTTIIKNSYSRLKFKVSLRQLVDEYGPFSLFRFSKILLSFFIDYYYYYYYYYYFYYY